ncbi:hypothetical protein [Streptomyces minutiscleroticus]|nr:hypothetical protein [Streptomyces minutiscleroticus]
MFYKLHVHRGRKGEPKTFAGSDYRDFIRMVHRQLGTPVVWVWDCENGSVSSEPRSNPVWD